MKKIYESTYMKMLKKQKKKLINAKISQHFSRIRIQIIYIVISMK